MICEIYREMHCHPLMISIAHSADTLIVGVATSDVVMRHELYDRKRLREGKAQRGAMQWLFNLYLLSAAVCRLITDV